MRPEGRTEPGIEHVLLADELVSRHGRFVQVLLLGADQPLAVLLVAMPDHVVAAGKRILQIGLARRLAVPYRNLMSPPKLPADRPVALLAEPIEIALRIPFRHDLHSAVAHGVHGRLGQMIHFHEPLVGQERFDRRLRAVAMGQLDLAILGLRQEPQLLQVGHHGLPGLGNG